MKPLDNALDFIAPHHCYGCNTEGTVCCQKCLDEISDTAMGTICYKCSSSIAEGLGICNSCKKSGQYLDSVSWYADYSEPLASRLIKSLKFSHLFASAKPISIATSKLISCSKHNCVVTSIPTANKRIRARGWDQAKLIAKNTAKQKNLTYKSLLIRTSSFDQIGASKIQRSQASEKFFKPIRRAHIGGQIIILVDDIVTTGSTLNSAARVLKSVGAKEVHAVTFARQGLKRNTNRMRSKSERVS